MSEKEQAGVEKVKVGFVGVGRMGQCAHLRNYASLPECEVVAISEMRPQTAKAVAQKYGVSKVYNEAAEMLENEKLDAIVASQPFARHGTLIPKLLKANKPIFIEKPLSNTVESGQKLLEAIKNSNTWVMLGYHKRSDPASMFAKEELKRLKTSGELGKVKYIRAIMPAGDWIAGGFFDLVQGEEYPAMPEDVPLTDLSKENYGLYRNFVNYYIHQLNLIRYFLEEDYDVTYADPGGVLLAGRSKSGVACTLEMTPYRTTVDWQESVLICFEYGWIKLELPAPLVVNQSGKVTLFRDPGNGKIPETVIPQFPSIQAMRQQAINFLAAVRGEIKPMSDAHEALKDLKNARQYLKLWKGV